MSGNGEKVPSIFDKLAEIEFREFLQDVGCPHHLIEGEASKLMEERALQREEG